MYYTPLLTTLFLTSCVLTFPLQQTPHLSIYKESEVPPELLRIDRNNGNFEIIPTNVTVAEDTGGNFGDQDYSYRGQESSYLIARETIVNAASDTNLRLYYTNTYPGFYVDAAKVINFGRERGVSNLIIIDHTDSYVEVRLSVAKGVAVRMFVEVYGRQL